MAEVENLLFMLIMNTTTVIIVSPWSNDKKYSTNSAWLWKNKNATKS